MTQKPTPKKLVLSKETLQKLAHPVASPGAGTISNRIRCTI